MSRTTVCALLFAVSLTVWGANLPRQVRDKPIYEIFAISYGVIPDFRSLDWSRAPTALARWTFK